MDIFEHIYVMQVSSLLRARVNRQHLKTAEKIFHTLGLKTGDAVNLFLAQVALRKDLPFSVTSRPSPLLTPDQQAEAWNRALGEY
jgi:addiction module RelB/DinJ family antitoxin